MAFLRYFPGVYIRYGDVDDMPHYLWRRCRAVVDQIEGRV